jgi:ABC-2 type transport system permease protein
MVRKDLRRRLRRPLGYLLMLSFPPIFAGMLALAFGTGEVRLPRVHLLVEDRDEGFLGDLLMSGMTSPEFAEHFEVESVGPEGMARMEAGEASALLILPETFTDDLLDGRHTTLRLVRNPAERILPEAAEQGAAILADGLSAASRVLRGPLDDLGALVEDDRAPTEAEVAAISVAIHRVMSRSGTFLFPPAITLEAATAPGDEGPRAGTTVGSIFLLVLPGVSVYALFVLGDTQMRDLLNEAQARTLHRQLSGPAGASTLILAKALYTGIVSVGGLVVLAAVGALAGARDVDAAGFAALSLALVAAVTGFAAVVYGLARSQRSGGTIAGIVYLVMGFASGSFVQLESLPPAARRIAPFTPFYWATQGYQALLRDGAGLADLLPHLGILLGSGAALLVLGAALMRRRLAGGIA